MSELNRLVDKCILLSRVFFTDAPTSSPVAFEKGKLAYAYGLLTRILMEGFGEPFAPVQSPSITDVETIVRALLDVLEIPSPALPPNINMFSKLCQLMDALLDHEHIESIKQMSGNALALRKLYYGDYKPGTEDAKVTILQNVYQWLSAVLNSLGVPCEPEAVPHQKRILQVLGKLEETLGRTEDATDASRNMTGINKRIYQLVYPKPTSWWRLW